MQLAFHMGALCTDEDQLVRSLRKNHDRLADEGIIVPAPGRYRPILGETLRSLKGADAPPEMQQTLLDAITDHDAPARIVLSSETFLGATNAVIGNGLLYPRAMRKTPLFARLFPEAECTFFLGIRNPAAFLPALHARVGAETYENMMQGADPMQLRWSDLVARLREANPDIPLTVWCDEDTPLIWPEVMHAVAGLEADAPPLTGEHDRLHGLMRPEGEKRLKEYLAANPPMTAGQRQRIVAAFLDKFAREDELEVELDLPGWSEEHVAAMSDAYEADCAVIARTEGVTFLG